MDRKINIYEANLKISEENILTYNCEDEPLVTAINDFKSNLDTVNIEVFKQINNIIITEKGYYFALFEDEVENTDLPEKAPPWQDKKYYDFDKDDKLI